MKQVLLTGATGFIGRQTIDPLIRRDFEVHCTYRTKKPDTTCNEKNVIWHKVDLLNRNNIEQLFESVSPEYLLHLAWDVTPGLYLESIHNFDWLVSSLNLLHEFSASGGTRAVCAGTCFEYDLMGGNCTEYVTSTRPTTYYGICKSHLQSIGEKYADKADFDFAWGRIFYPYGPFEHPARLVPSVINSLLTGEIAQCTHGNQIRDFLHVADVADAFVALLDTDVNGIVNIGSGKPVSIKELVLLIANNLRKEEDVRLGALPSRENEPPVIVADTNRLKKEVHCCQKYSLEEGIMDTISWWKKFGTCDNY
jgi:nucleoside-diphosphate-sugar epimerase